MKVVKRVEAKIKEFEAGTVFDISFVSLPDASQEAIAQCLSRFYRNERIGKLCKGVYYKLNPTPFGEAGPSEKQLLEYLTKDEDRYMTGLRIYNSMGLTTQVPNVITFAIKYRKPDQKFGNIKINYVLTRNEINKENVPLFQLLDAIKDLKRIPDGDMKLSIRILKNKFKKLGKEKWNRLIEIAMNYRPATRALVGAIGEYLGFGEMVKLLKQSLNSISKFEFGIPEELLAYKEKLEFDLR